MLYRITDKKLSLPITQRIFGCGTITLHAKDSDTPTKTIKSIRHPRAVMGTFGQRDSKSAPGQLCAGPRYGRRP